MFATATVLVATVAMVEVTAAGPGFGATFPQTLNAALKPTQLVLTIAKGEAGQPVERRASLTCTPAGGSHKQARNACTELSKVGGNFDRLQLDGGLCTMQWDPVTVTATGRWKGRKVGYKHTFGNACSLSTATGPVFSL